MALRCGIVGLPNVGKSTLFNVLTAAGAEAANYPFCTIEPNLGIVTVPDQRLLDLAGWVGSAKITPTAIEFVDIAGLVAGASKGEGLGNQFLSHIREVDAIVHVVRCFEDENIVHVMGDVDPLRDIEIINTELLLRDLDTVEKRIERVEKAAKGDKTLRVELTFLERLCTHLAEGKPARTFPFNEAEVLWLKPLFLLSNKPVLYAANVAEAALHQSDHPHVQVIQTLASQEGAEVVMFSAGLEAQLVDLDADERALFLEELGLKESGLDRLIQGAYALLDLITYFTTGPKESRAWTIRRGTKAPQAAGLIHTDFERGFIRAETIKFEDFRTHRSEAAARDAGAMRSEGKAYLVQDGDVILFRFNV